MTTSRCRLGLWAPPLLRVSLTAPAPLLAPVPLSLSWASWAPLEACCCGDAGVVSGRLGAPPGVQPQICCLWVPAVRDSCCRWAKSESALANSSLTDTRSSSSSSLEMSGEVLPGRTDPRHTRRNSWSLFFHSEVPQKGYCVGWPSLYRCRRLGGRFCEDAVR